MTNKNKVMSCDPEGTETQKMTAVQTPVERVDMKEIRPDTVSFPVGAGEDPWTEAEIAEVREELVSDIDRMEKALAEAEAELTQLMAEGGDGAGRDAADVGSANFERDQEMSLNANAKEMLEQCKRAMERLDDGTYGVCESCGQPIGKVRLQVFPRATMCVTCKQREERR